MMGINNQGQITVQAQQQQQQQQTNKITTTAKANDKRQRSYCKCAYIKAEVCLYFISSIIIIVIKESFTQHTVQAAVRLELAWLLKVKLRVTGALVAS